MSELLLLIFCALSTLKGMEFYMDKKVVLDVNDTPPPIQWLTLSLQHLFAMFGATVLVPILTGLSPSVALVSSGLGTLAFLAITKFQVPAYLGSSFAFITPIIVAKASGGIGMAMIGSLLAGLIYGIVAIIIKMVGYKWLMRLLPPIVVGPVIIVIGLGLAGTAVNMATMKTLADGVKQEYSLLHFSAALVTLAVIIIATMYFKGIWSMLPILFGITAGYLYSLAVGLVDLSGIDKAAVFEIPPFVLPFVNYDVHITPSIIGLMVPVAIVTLSEHIGHQLVLSKVVGRNFIEKPGLHRSILGDGVSTIISALIGGPPRTTYGENIGVMAITRVYSVFVLAGAAVIAIILGFVGKVSAVISSIPTPVMGGVSILLFGIIASSGFRMLVDAKTDLGDKRNLIISSVIVVIGIGGATIKYGDFELSGMALAAILGVLLNLILPGRKKEEEDLFGEQK